jgi:O-antigen ligase
LAGNPRLLMFHFGTPTLTPELASRLNANRAFGSFLFANALAAYLILGIPYMIGECANGLLRFRSTSRGQAAGEPNELIFFNSRAMALLLGFVVFFIAFCIAYFLYPQLYLYATDRKDWMTDKLPFITFVVLFPLALGAIPALCVGLLGVKRGWLAFQNVFLASTAAIAAYVLWLTVSRGGTLALIAASMAGVALLWWANRSPFMRQRKATRAAAAGMGIALVVASAFGGMSNAAAQANPPAVHATVPAAPPADPNAPKLLEEGVNVKLNELADPTTLKMRAAYWRTGLRMGFANFWTGTGFGTFQSAYARYQDVTTPPVKAAHNDYVQVFAETGVFGALFFIAFWGFFLVWGLLQIPRETHRGKRWALTGLYVGVLAFLIHSLVDFNFYNPSLAMTQFVLAGLFLSRTGIAEGDRLPRLPQQALIVVMLGLTGLAGATAARVQTAHAAVGDEPVANTRFTLANTLAGVNPKTYRADNLLQIPYADLAMFVPDRKLIESLGVIYLPAAEGATTYKPVLPNAPLTPQQAAVAIVLVRNPANAGRVAVESVRARMGVLEWAHSLYPRDPQVVAELFRWSDFLRLQAKDKSEEADAIMSMEKWSEEGVRLSPESAAFRGYHGNSLLRRGLLEKDAKRAVQFYRDAIEEYRNSTERWPSNEALWNEYAGVLRRYGEAFKKYGLKEEGERYVIEAQHADEVVKKIQEARKR